MASGCNSLFDIGGHGAYEPDREAGAASAGDEGGAATPRNDAGTVPPDDDAGGAPDSGCASDPEHALASPDSWRKFDVAHYFDPWTTKGFAGATFDGRYIYFVPQQNGAYDGVLVRYDTTRNFEEGASWNRFDTSDIDPHAVGYLGAAFDGTYVYFAPFLPSTPVLRYKPGPSLSDPSAWKAVPLPSVGIAAAGFGGAVFAKPYVYFVPDGNMLLPSEKGTPHGTVVRYDTSSPDELTKPVSWRALSTNGLDANANGFVGGVLADGQIYMMPKGQAHFVRLDTTADFANWWTYRQLVTTTIDTNAWDYAGGAFDGAYVYLVPADNGSGKSVALRCDSRKAFDPASCDRFETTNILPSAKGYYGAAFDGRYVYYAPYAANPYLKNDQPNGLVLRFDRCRSFTARDAWEHFDMRVKDEALATFAGAVFDGRYIYFVPTRGGMVGRFDTGRSLPPGQFVSSFL